MSEGCKKYGLSSGRFDFVCVVRCARLLKFQFWGEDKRISGDELVKLLK